ncbi:MAG TPA: hypothetical protein VFX89_16270 [Gammaproteobacteria bacterium]|nr:hypothetical protein [Gammaproteobacteria bacterium]
MFKRATIYAVSACACLATADSCAEEKASFQFEEAFALYGPGIFPAITQVARCGDYRVLVVYGNGTDMLFLDKLVRVDNESTFAATDGFSFREFNFYEDSNQIESVSCKEAGPGELRIVGRAYSFHSEKHYDFSIVMDTARQSYTFEPPPTER